MQLELPTTFEGKPDFPGDHNPLPTSTNWNSVPHFPHIRVKRWIFNLSISGELREIKIDRQEQETEVFTFFMGMVYYSSISLQNPVLEIGTDREFLPIGAPVGPDSHGILKPL